MSNEAPLQPNIVTLTSFPSYYVHLHSPVVFKIVEKTVIQHNGPVCCFLKSRYLTCFLVSVKPKLLSAEVKNSRVILRIVLPLLAKALYEFGFFEGIL